MLLNKWPECPCIVSVFLDYQNSDNELVEQLAIITLCKQWSCTTSPSPSGL